MYDICRNDYRSFDLGFFVAGDQYRSNNRVTISSSIFAAFPYVHDKVEDRRKRKGAKIPLPPSIYDYCFPRWKLLLISTLTVFGLLNFHSAAASIISSSFTDAAFALGFTTVFIAIPMMIPIGRFVGSRSNRHGIIVLFLAVIISRLAATTIDFWLVSDGVIAAEKYRTVTGFDPGWQILGIQLLAAPLIFAPAALFGFWRGRRRRLASYLVYLMKRVKPEVRNTIVELAYDEAAKSATEGSRLATIETKQEPSDAEPTPGS